MKSHQKKFHGYLSFLLIRRLESLIPIGLFCHILYVFFYIRAVLSKTFSKPRSESSLPQLFYVPKTLAARLKEHTNRYIYRAIRHIPDRIVHPKWRDRCRIEGFHHLEEAEKDGEAVVLVFSHFGPYQLLHLWLRAYGQPAAVFTKEVYASRSRLKRHQDSFCPMQDIPVAIFGDELRHIPAFLYAKNILVIAIDSPRGKQMTVPFCPGWNFEMATGPFRLASRYGTRLISCVITNEGPMRFKIRLDALSGERPLLDGTNWQRLGQRLLDSMKPTLQSYPEQCREIVRCFKMDV